MNTKTKKSNKSQPSRPVGRPRRETPRVSLSVKLEPEDLRAFQEMAKSAGVSQSRLLTQWIVRTRKSVQAKSLWV